MQDQKPKRKENRPLLDTIKKEPCIICGFKPCDPCHIYSVGAGGPDMRWNVVAMCRKHHTEQHTIGWATMWNKYVIVKMKLTGLGWRLMNGKLFNEEG